MLDREQIHRWNRDGFLTIDRVTSNDDVALIRKLIENLFKTNAGFSEGALFNLVGKDEDLDSTGFPQIVGPRHYAAELRNTEFFANASAIAKQLLGTNVRFMGDHTLAKPAINGPATPWHQDEAFHSPDFDYNEISFWLPLQEVNQENGCMEFIAGTHKSKMLPHRPFMNDRNTHGLECYEGFDPKDAIPCPLRLGSCTIHTGRTLHGAGPNLSNTVRYAYVVVFGIPPQSAKNPKFFPWHIDHETDRNKRMRAWMKNGGFFVAIWRFLKESSFKDVQLAVAKLRLKIAQFLSLFSHK
jgi:hypothetical protein